MMAGDLIGIVGVISISVVAILLVFYQFVFLRNPHRAAPGGNNIVSPADGRIINIMKIDDSNLRIKKGLMGKVDALCSDVDAGYLVSIFMSIFDVHVNRAPIDGEVVGVKHRDGRFFMAFDKEKSLLNESNEIIIKSEIGRIKVIQIAGFIARRIQCFVKEKQKINKGESIGRIVIGSQVCLIIPKKVRLVVNVGGKVRAGETILGEF